MIVLLIIAVAIFVVVIIFSVSARQNPADQSDRSKKVVVDKGDFGEYVVAKTLGDTEPGKQYVINNFCFSVKGKSCQIDHILINSAGIWVIETKNMSGKIYGKEEDGYWRQVLGYGNTVNKFYNPKKQNATHIYRLKYILGNKHIFHNVVCFLDGADLSEVFADNVYTVFGLVSIKEDPAYKTLSPQEMEKYYYKLYEFWKTNGIGLEEHIMNIRQAEEKLSEGICPRCGGRLVPRTGKYGQFWGCENYPKCKFHKTFEDNEHDVI